jgi:hypothetical protein
LYHFPRIAPPELALPKSTALPAPAPTLPAENQDRFQVEDNFDPPIPDLQQYEVKTVTAEPDKPSPSHWLEFGEGFGSTRNSP